AGLRETAAQCREKPAAAPVEHARCNIRSPPTPWHCFAPAPSRKRGSTRQYSPLNSSILHSALHSAAILRRTGIVIPAPLLQLRLHFVNQRQVFVAFHCTIP